MEEPIFKKDFINSLLVIILFIMLGVSAIYIRGLQDQLNRLEQKTDQQSTSQQAQIDGLSLNIETVRNDMQAGFENQQAQIDSQQEQISSQKNVQSNTIKAFIRFQKQQAEQAEEFKEELKKD